MKLIIGLGNPGKKYERTRHNAGFLVADALTYSFGGKWNEGKGPFELSEAALQDYKLIIAKPALFMNESGKAIRIILDQFHISPDECLVVSDDVNLPLGKIRFRMRGSAGGHHGLESIVEALGTQNFPRLRVGIAKENFVGKDLVDYVLGNFSKEEWALLLPEIERAKEACLEWIKSGAHTVMQRYNH